jgi:hypothetical protein
LVWQFSAVQNKKSASKFVPSNTNLWWINTPQVLDEISSDLHRSFPNIKVLKVNNRSFDKKSMNERIQGTRNGIRKG